MSLGNDKAAALIADIKAEAGADFQAELEVASGDLRKVLTALYAQKQQAAAAFIAAYKADFEAYVAALPTPKQD